MAWMPLTHAEMEPGTGYLAIASHLPLKRITAVEPRAALLLADVPVLRP
jgi:hypothetical protein